MDFTGERLVPDQQRDSDLYHEHMARYLFAAQWAQGRDVLDAGCGAGYGSAVLASAGAQSVLGVDIAPDAVAYAQQHYSCSGLAFAVKDIGHLDLPDAGFDLIVSFEVIEHLDDPALLVQSAARLLRPDGLFVVSTPNAATYPAGNPFHKHEMALAEFEAVLGCSFPAFTMFEEDYATAIALRRAPGRPDITPGASGWTVVPAEQRETAGPDYYLAVCARQQDALDRALSPARNILYEVPADHLAERDAHIAHMETEFRRQAAWAAELEQQVRELTNLWYVRLLRRRLR